MAGDLKALLLAAPVLAAIKPELIERDAIGPDVIGPAIGPVVPLAPGTGLALVPLPGGIPARVEEPEQARRLSAHGTVAYVHSEFFAGDGFQAAVAWRDGEVVWGPVYTATREDEAEDHYVVAGHADMAINQVLRWLGVRPAGEVDEFAAAGLDRFRWTGDWAPGGTEVS